MNILYCGDKGISRGVLISILSLLMNGRRQYDGQAMVENDTLEIPIYNIYIMTIRYKDVVPFPEKTVKFLDKLAKSYNSKNFVKLIDATEVFVKNLPSKNMGSYFTPCSMLRLYMDKVPEISKLERVLYLDYDVVCRGDITEFYNMDMTDVEAVGVLDIYGRRWYHYHGLFKQDYMNSGVMLFNIPECVKTGMFERAVDLCTKRWMLLADQSALNKSIARRILVDRKYNEQEERPRPDTALHHFSNNFKFWPYFRVQKVKPFEIEKVHDVLGVYEYDDIFGRYNELKNKL